MRAAPVGLAACGARKGAQPVGSSLTSQGSVLHASRRSSCSHGSASPPLGITLCASGCASRPVSFREHVGIKDTLAGGKRIVQERKRVVQRLRRFVKDPDISNPVCVGYAAGESEFRRLDRAMALDTNAALQSASWEIRQLMGFNFALSGFSSIEVMVAAMVRDEDSQLMATANFIIAAGMGPELWTESWIDVAREYNGVGFARNQYSVKLAKAYQQYQAAVPDLRIRSTQVAPQPRLQSGSDRPRAWAVHPRRLGHADPPPLGDQPYCLELILPTEPPSRQHPDLRFQ
jgi:hypothetical protein